MMFPDDADVQKVKAHIFDPFEYLMMRHKKSLLNLDFKESLGKIAYHAACHLRVQNMGYKTRELLQLVEDTTRLKLSSVVLVTMVLTRLKKNSMKNL